MIGLLYLFLKDLVCKLNCVSSCGKQQRSNYRDSMEYDKQNKNE